MARKNEIEVRRTDRPHTDRHDHDGEEEGLCAVCDLAENADGYIDHARFAIIRAAAAQRIADGKNLKGIFTHDEAMEMYDLLSKIYP